MLGTCSPVKVAIAGLGAIGHQIAALLDRGIPGIELTAVSAKHLAKAETKVAALSKRVPVVELTALEPYADLVVECAPPHLFREIAEPFLRKGKDVVALSATALLSYPDLIELAKANQCQITVPTGAILGLDGLAAASEGKIQHVRLTTKKPPQALARSPYFLRHKIDASTIKEPIRVFAGTPREAAPDFPTNINVAVTLALAGIGLDQTELEIWADPGVQRNTHTIHVVADVATFSMTIENVPSDNPSTSKIAALSVIAYLRKLNTPLRIGS